MTDNITSPADPNNTPTGIANDINVLIGKSLRVLKPGQMGDMMFNPFRVTIHVDANNMITAVNFG